MSATSAAIEPAVRIRELASAEGFPLVRFAPADPIREAGDAARERHNAGLLDGLDWMTEDWLRRATDPSTFLEGARSVVLLGLPYGAPGPGHASGEGPSRGRIARYAQGRDYHRVFEKKLRRMARAMREELGASARPTVDYGPLLERPLAAASGMGWLGKSTMLLVPGFGPWVMLGAIATSLELPAGQPLLKTCGSCTRCIVACPTMAIAADGSVLDARLCISYHTIENGGAIPRELRAKFGAWIFGCDDCLEACPVGAHNTTINPELVARGEDDIAPALAPLLALDDAAFRERYQGRPIIRAKRDGFVRNVCVALGNVGTAEDLPALEGALNDASSLVRGHAAWAVARLGSRLALPVAATLENARVIEQDPYVREELQSALAELQFAPG